MPPPTVTVSIILPAFNAARHIREALRSVLAQTYSALDVIVVDDGSTDETHRIVGEIAASDRRVRLIRQANAGVGAARNAAIRIARGVYVATIDADDLWSHDKIEKQVARMEDRGSETGMVYCWSRIVDANGNVSRLGRQYAVEGRIAAALLLRNFVGNASTPLYRADALAAVGPYLLRDEQGGAQGFEDWDLNLRIAERFEVGAVPEFLVDYQRREASMSMDTNRMARSFEIAIRRARERNPHLPSKHFRRAVGCWYFYLTCNADSSDAHRNTLLHLCTAVWADPALLLSKRVYRIIYRSVVRLLGGRRIARKRPGGKRRAQTTHRTGLEEAAAVLPIGQGTYGRILERRLRNALVELQHIPDPK